MRKSKFTESQIAEIQKEAEAGVAMAELAHKHGAWGCRKLHRQLRVEVHRINHKRTERLYAVHNLARPRRQRRRLSAKRGHVAISTEVMRCNVAIVQKTHFVSGPSDNTTRDELGSGIEAPTGCLLIRAQQSRQVRLLQDKALGQTPRAATPLVFEVDPPGPGSRMPKRLPQHGQVLILEAQANHIFDADPLGIAALQPVGDIHRTALARFARAAQQPLIPSARCQFIPDERGNAL